MAAQIQVELIGANGSRTTEVNAAGFTTRHVKAPRELVPSLFGDVSIKQPPNPTTPQSLQSLLAEVDAALDPKPRVNTEPITNDCYHYSGYTVKPKPDYESGTFAIWNSIRQKRSDAEMAYRRNRAKAVA